MKVFIFACNNETMTECIFKNLFGVAKPYPKQIKQGDYCLLYNYDDKKVYGLWKAISLCGWHDKRAWGGRFKFQVKVQLVSKSMISIPFKILANLTGDPLKNWLLYGEKAHNIIQFYASEFSQKVKIGIELHAYEEDYRLKYPPKFICEDGHRVRSLPEKTIDDWLSKHQIYHAYEPVVPIPEKIIPDFMVTAHNGTNVYIEYWGYEGDPVYKERMNKKCKIYADRQLPLIEIRYEDLQKLDIVFPEKLLQKGIVMY